MPGSLTWAYVHDDHAVVVFVNDTTVSPAQFAVINQILDHGLC